MSEANERRDKDSRSSACYVDALTRRIEAEESAKAQQCGVTGCTNTATHTWSGHPTCDDCGTPGRKKLPFPVVI